MKHATTTLITLRRRFSTESKPMSQTDKRWWNGLFTAMPESIHSHLKWIKQKQLLRQDVLLLGPPPSMFARRIALEFAKRNELEVEIVSLTLDTTESDLKTRRDLVNRSVVFADQAPVRAAIQGKMLILDGLEKCERNVLPTLNNLLENREMNLDDGRLLVSHERYQHLLKKASAGTLTKSGIISTHPRFFVVALAAPTPPYSGRPLDPPLRSRFQVRRVEFPHSGELISAGLVSDQVARITATINAASDLNPKIFPRLSDANILHVSNMHTQNANTPLSSVLARSYPWLVPELNFPHRTALQKLIQGLDDKQTAPQKTSVDGESAAATRYLPPARQRILSAMLDDHVMSRDIILCGPAGSGKSLLAQSFAKALNNRRIIVFPLHRDMTSRDLIARRATNQETGDTTWEPSPLVKAARNGDILILDGVEKVEAALVAVARLFQDRELEFIDGTRLDISPSFRVIALASTTGQEKKASFQFLTPEILSMFSTHILSDQIEEKELMKMLLSEHPGAQVQLVQKLLVFSSLLGTKAKDSGLGRLSLRSLFRITQRLALFPSELVLASQIERVLLGPFLPQSQRVLLRKLIAEANIHSDRLNSSEDSVETQIQIDQDRVAIGRVQFPRYPQKSRPDLVPKVLFYDMPHHRKVLQQMLEDYVAGFRHFVLIGNQGVGKNKLADRMLELLNAEREYIQLHRDSTVAGLTGAPTLRDGQVVWEDSPLVRAAKLGRVLVVDEADKAPPEVIAVLKSLVEDGDMLLGNGKRLLKHVSTNTEDEIQIHPDFSVWILSNRPGFPFHGNDFYKQVGDVFATHIIDNPDLDSELELLRWYASTTDANILIAIARCFADLRKLADEGIITYPYSTREAVNVAKHLEAFPEDGVVTALHNVLDFDSYQPETAKVLSKVFQKHGIPFSFALRERPSLGADMGSLQPLPELTRSGEVWRVSR